MNHRSDHEHDAEGAPGEREPILDPNAHPDESGSAGIDAGARFPERMDEVRESASGPEDHPRTHEMAAPSADPRDQGQAGERSSGADGDDEDDGSGGDDDGRLRLRLGSSRREGRSMFSSRGTMVAGIVLVLGVAAVAVVRFSSGDGLLFNRPDMMGRPGSARSGPDPWADASADGSADAATDVAQPAASGDVLTDSGGTPSKPSDVSHDMAAGGSDHLDAQPASRSSGEPAVSSSGAIETGRPKPLTQVGPPDEASPILPPSTARSEAPPPSMASPGSAIDLSADDDESSPRTRSTPVRPRVRNAERDEAQRFLTKAVRALAAGEYTASLEAGDAAWTLDPTNARVANHMATVHLTLGEWATADTWCRRALDADYEYAPAWTNLGLAYLRQGHPGEAEKIHRQGVERNPRDWKAMAGLAAALRDLDRYDEAMDTYRRAVLVAPHEPALRYNMAVTLERAERMEEAGVEFERYLRLSGGRNPAREKQVLEWLERHRTP